MLETPFSVIRCSWPRPVVHEEGCWTSEPDWEAPAMPALPQPQWSAFGGERIWMLDWREAFRGDLRLWPGHQGAEMRGFHVVFVVRVHGSGTLAFWDDDGCIIRRNGQIVHTDRSAHQLTRHEILVSAGDHLEVAHWQLHGGWLWGAQLIPAPQPLAEAAQPLKSYLPGVQAFLRQPNGPPLKMMVQGNAPLCTVLALYSLILNGYRPSEILIWGEHQWSPACREVLSDLLPFARVMSTRALLDRVAALGGVELVQRANLDWFVLKTCIELLHPPETFCFMDDDVFILDTLDDALHAFQDHDLVFAPDADYGPEYVKAWECLNASPPDWPTRTFNEGLYWMRNRHDPQALAEYILQSPQNIAPHIWGQGFIAALFAAKPVMALPAQRYFYPVFDGLPGGIKGYDYAGNPCGFASVHFGGLRAKPNDMDALILASSVLRRRIQDQFAHTD